MTDATAIRTQPFIDALATLERYRDAEPIAALFAPESEIGNIVSLHEFTGPEGAREFWTAYRETFGEMQSEFRNVIEGEDRAALEWTTTGTSAHGAPVTYSGVSIIEYADDQITRFRAYFDPGDLGRQMEQGGTAGG
ncbi:MAG: nuclear transport factor 2 family protein [Thermomicrobiales bacterium]